MAVQIDGGLGNQLFQYAAGRALAEKLGAKLILDRTPRIAKPRKYLLDQFSIQGDAICDAPRRIRPRFRLKGKLGRRLTQALYETFPPTVRIGGHSFRIVYERRWFTYDPRFDAGFSGSIYLAGFWQSYRYSQGAAALIRSELLTDWAPTQRNREWLDRIRQSNSVALHVRRGDYLSARLQADFGICSPAYYARAIQTIRERTERAQFFVFSDDLAWCRDHLPADDVQFVDANGPDEAAADLRLMATCRHHIIANSSFSWWAAWLADRTDQIVIAPDPWFLNMPSAPDLMPERWIRMPRG